MIRNPFEYEAANRLSDDEVLDYYHEGHTYSRFIRSKRNIFLIGERGTGKTMTFKYNSLQVQQRKAARKGVDIDLGIICIYVPCNTPIIHKLDYELYKKPQANIISEHFLVLPLLFEFASVLGNIPDIENANNIGDTIKEIEYCLDIKLPKNKPLFGSLKLFFQREIVTSQKVINNNAPKGFLDRPFSLLSGVIPLLMIIKKLPRFINSHFSFLIDDAHMLNETQNRVLNSWIAFRDNTLFSFKVASTKVGRPHMLTKSGGDILEGHDYTLVDLEAPYQNDYSRFGRLARKIIRSRMDQIKVPAHVTPEMFFPENGRMKEAILKCEQEVRKEKMMNDPDSDGKVVSDYVYKYGRVRYFRERSLKANRPPYSGFEQLIHISTGVIRNLLEPCYYLYEEALSTFMDEEDDELTIMAIPPPMQTKVILKLSRQRWETLRRGLDSTIDGCTREQARQLKNLFNQLALLFRIRLLKHESEPRAIVFSISGERRREYSDLHELLIIARKAQLLYTYTGSGKEMAKRETYYVPNRILWPEKGLDPVGQYSRVSLQAKHLWVAALNNEKIPMSKDEKPKTQELFDE